MKKLLFLILISLLSVKSYSQIKYENGYFIKSDGSKISCFIKNMDWKNNPREFTYRFTENSEELKADIKTVLEFGISNFAKYIRFSVEIDSSSEDMNHMSSNRNPEFSTRELFLKVLVEGKATLYYFEEGTFSKYFFTLDSSNAEQLIFKSYLNSENEIKENNSFKQQLVNNLKCQKITPADIERIRYRNSDLVRIFTLYNECQNSGTINYEQNANRDNFNMSVRPGLNYSSLQINSLSHETEIDFGKQLTFRLGVEIESILPFNKNKWALIIEPTFRYFNSENSSNNRYYMVDYKSIELPFGVRYYLFLNEKSKIYLNSSYVIDFDLNSEISSVSGRWAEITSRSNLAFGIGYNQQNKYSVEIRYSLSRDIIKNSSFDSQYKTFSLIFGYNLF